MMNTNQTEILLALTRLDEKVIRDHLLACGITPPADDKAFWIGIHKVRATMQEIPEQFRIDSQIWLKTIGVDYKQQKFHIEEAFELDVV